MDTEKEQSSSEVKSGFRWSHFFAGVCVFLLVVLLVCFWWYRSNFYASKFRPVELSQKEEAALQGKLQALEDAGERQRAVKADKRAPDGSLIPELYSEEGANREIFLTERELNGMIAHDPETAKVVAIDLAQDLVSLKLVVPVDDEIAIFGGKTIRLKAGVKIAYAEGLPIIALKGVTLGGVPVPNAWLGGLKHQNLLTEFGEEGGFWSLFSEGVDKIYVQEGSIRIRLKP